MEKATSERGADSISLSSALRQVVPSGRTGRQSEVLRRASGLASGALGSTAAPFGDTMVAATSHVELPDHMFCYHCLASFACVVLISTWFYWGFLARAKGTVYSKQAFN